MTNLRRSTSLTLAVFGLFVASCGVDAVQPPAVEAGAPAVDSVPAEGRIEPEASVTTTPPNDAPPTSIATEPAMRLEERPAFEAPDRANNNDPKKDLGAVCWARTELTHFFLDQLEVDGVERPKAKYQDLDEALDAVEPALAHGRTTERASDFVAHFESQVAVARTSAQGKRLSGEAALALAEELFNFDNYPGVEDYVNVASASAGCNQP